MNWLDGIIGFISPEWGARREAWRQSLTEMRNYDAGNYDRGNANWRVLNQSAEFTDRYSRDNVRARARDFSHRGIQAKCHWRRLRTAGKDRQRQDQRDYPDRLEEMVQETELRCDRNAVLHADDENVREAKEG